MFFNPIILSPLDFIVTFCYTVYVTSCYNKGSEVIFLKNFCEWCGTRLNPGAGFCPVCGRAIQSEQPPVGSLRSDWDTPTEESSDKWPICSMLLGLAGMAFAWIIALFGHIFSAVGIVVGIRQFKKSGNPAGLILSIMGAASSVISSIIGAAVMVNSL